MNLTLSLKKSIPGDCRPAPILSGTPSRSTPKKVLSHLNTPTSAQRTQGDRFIPSRVATNLDFSAHKLSFPSRVGNASSPSESDKRKVVYDKLLSLDGCSSETRVLRFRSTEAENTPTKYQYWSSYGTPKDHSAKKQGRRIPKSADKVLDAPDLQNDFYLNVLDWSARNHIAVALGSCVYLLDVDSGEITSFHDFESSALVTSLQWDTPGKSLAIGTSSAQIQIWDVATTKMTRTIQTHESRVSSLSWDPRGTTFLSSGSQSGSIHHHDTRDPQPVAAHELNAHSLEVCGLRWSPTGRLLASGGNDNIVNVWDPSSGTGWGTPSQTFTEHTAAVKALAWCPWQHSTLVTGGGSSDQHIRAWNVFTGKVESSVNTGSQVSSLLWSPTYRELVSTHGQPDNMLAIWSYPSLTKVGRMLGHEERILHAAMSPDGQTVATASADETLRFWKCFAADPHRPKEHVDVDHLEYSLQRYIR